jgi:hypothetical protein
LKRAANILWSFHRFQIYFHYSQNNLFSISKALAACRLSKTQFTKNDDLGSRQHKNKLVLLGFSFEKWFCHTLPPVTAVPLAMLGLTTPWASGPRILEEVIHKTVVLGSR